MEMKLNAFDNDLHDKQHNEIRPKYKLQTREEINNCKTGYLINHMDLDENKLQALKIDYMSQNMSMKMLTIFGNIKYIYH